MTDLRPGRGSPVFQIRLPEGMREQIKKEAAKNGRSMNAEIIDRLQRSLSHTGKKKVVTVYDGDVPVGSINAEDLLRSLPKSFLRDVAKEMLEIAKREADSSPSDPT